MKILTQKQNILSSKKRYFTRAIYLAISMLAFALGVNFYSTERKDIELSFQFYKHIEPYVYKNICISCELLPGWANFLKQSLPSFLSTVGVCFLFQSTNDNKNVLTIPLEVFTIMVFLEILQTESSRLFKDIKMYFDWIDIVAIALGCLVAISLTTLTKVINREKN